MFARLALARPTVTVTAAPCLARASRQPFSTSLPVLSGHNKWSKIKTKKGIEDARKSNVYGKAFKDIVVAIRDGGSADPEVNHSLATVLKKAKAAGVPSSNINGAIQKATAKGKDGGGSAIVYEALAFGSVGIIIECLTDNTNRTLHNVRDILTWNGAQFASVGFQFKRQGYVKIALDNGPDYAQRSEDLILAAMDAGAEDFTDHGSTESEEFSEIAFTCPTTKLAAVEKSLTGGEAGKIRSLQASELIYAPTDGPIEADEETKQRMEALVEAVEEDQDVLRVWTTIDG